MKRLLPFVFLILLLLGGIIAVPFLLQPERHRQEITDALSAVIKRPVVVGPLSMSYLPPTLHADQVAVMGNANAPFLQIGSASAPLDLASLFHLKFVPQNIELSHWRLDVQRKADGSWDLSDYLPQSSGLSSAKTWTLREVHLSDGEVHWTDRFAAVPQELAMTSVSGHWDPRPETLDLQGVLSGLAAGTQVSLAAKGQFFISPQWSGDLTLSDQGNSAVFHIAKSAGSLDVKGQSVRWRLASALALLKFYARASATSVDASNPLTLENWQAHASDMQGRVAFEHSAGISGGGLTEAKGNIEKGPQGLVAHAELAAKDVPAGVAWDMIGQKLPLDGKVTAIVKGFEITLSSGAASTIGGEGSIELNDGRYQPPEVSLKKLSKAKTLTYLQQKFPELSTKGIPVTKLSAQWKAKNGIAVIDNASLVSTDIKAAWTGKVDIAKEGLDGYIRLEIREKNPKLRKLVPLKYQTQPAFGRLQGTWQEWSLRAVAPSKVPAAVQSKLRKAIGH